MTQNGIQSDGLPSPATLRVSAAWTICSQILSSGGNFALGVLLARRLSPAEFGRVSLLVLVVFIGAELVRCMTAEALYGRRSTSAADAVTAVRASFVVGVAIASVAAVPAVLVWTDGVTYIGVVAAAFPFLAAFDTQRLAWIRLGNPRAAAIVDSMWTVAFVVGALIAPATGLAALVVWSIPAVVGGTLFLKHTQAARPLPTWWRSVRHQGLHLAVDLLVGRGAVTVAMFAIGAVGTAADVGAIRGAEVLFGPLVVAATGLRRAVLAKDAGLARSAASMRRSAVVWSVAIGGGALASGVALSALPEQLGEQLLGPTWHESESLLVLAAISVAGSITLLFLRGPFQLQGATGVYLRFRIIAVPFLILPPVVLASGHGAIGGQLGLTVGRIVSVLLVLEASRRVVRGFSHHATDPIDRTEPPT